MKTNRVTDVIFALAVFAAFITCFALIYTAVELLNYTTFYEIETIETEELVQEVNLDGYFELQYPVAICILTGGIAGTAGAVSAVIGYSVKNKVAKCVLCGVSFIAFIAFIILFVVTDSIWLGTYGDRLNHERIWYIWLSSGKKPILLSGTTNQQYFTLYSLAMSSLVAPLAMFFVIVCILGYALFCTFYKKKDKAEQVAESGKAEEGESQNTENL